MVISKKIKVVIGILTAYVMVYPFLAPFVMLFLMFSSGFMFFDPEMMPSPEFMRSIMPMMMVLLPVMFCSTIIQMGLQIFYVAMVLKNKQFSDSIRILFALGMFFMPYVAMPLYFIAYFWKEDGGAASMVEPSTN
ncbi:MAG: hypothetical protein JXB15_09575 [Anaerolineales bacterium]|nr:hypothetical protein [Anaerolineales bacterium]